MSKRGLLCVALPMAMLAAAGVLGGCASVSTIDENPSWRTEYHWLGSQGRRAHSHRYDAAPAKHEGHHEHHHADANAYAPTDLMPEPAQMLPLAPAPAGGCCGKSCCGSHAGSAVTPH